MREWKRFLEIGDVLLKCGDFFAFYVVANHDGRAVRRFHAKQTIKINFVRSEDDVELWITEVHPGDVARIVIVREQGIGAEAEEFRESRIVTKRSGGAEIRGHGNEKFTKCDVIGNGLKSIVDPTDYRVPLYRPFLRGIRLDIGIEFLR